MANNNRPRRRAKEEPQKVLDIDLLSIVDDYNADAIQLCVSQLFPLFNYRIMKAEDVRPVDLKEKLIELSDRFVPQENQKAKKPVEVYCSVMTEYLNERTEIEAESRAAKYRERALELLAKALSPNGAVSDLEDALLIMLALFKPLRLHPVSTPDFNLTPMDAELAEELWITAIEPAEMGKGLIRKFRTRPATISSGHQ